MFIQSTLLRRLHHRLTHSKRRVSRDLTVSFACALAIATGAATSAKALSWDQVPSTDQIAEQATLSFRGRVADVYYADAAKDGERSLPYTITTFEVLRGYRGARKGDLVEIAQMGGPRSDRPNRVIVIPGTPSFLLGDEVVVFANAEEQPLFGTLFGDHGMLRVAESDRGERLVMSSSWHVLTEAGSGLSVDGARRCRPAGDQRGRCIDRSEESISAPDEEPARPRARALRASDFDARMAATRRGADARLRGEGLRANRPAFERAMRMLTNRLH